MRVRRFDFLPLTVALRVGADDLAPFVPGLTYTYVEARLGPLGIGGAVEYLAMGGVGEVGDAAEGSGGGLFGLPGEYSSSMKSLGNSIFAVLLYFAEYGVSDCGYVQ